MVHQTAAICAVLGNFPFCCQQLKPRLVVSLQVASIQGCCTIQRQSACLMILGYSRILGVCLPLVCLSHQASVFFARRFWVGCFIATRRNTLVNVVRQHSNRSEYPKFSYSKSSCLQLASQQILMPLPFADHVLTIVAHCCPLLFIVNDSPSLF